jgi:diguanylate cyclase (GGDEF)-like protein/PAS domain S-box-containing protein
VITSISLEKRYTLFMVAAPALPVFSRLPIGIKISLFGAAYLGFAFIGDLLTFQPSNFTTFWPVSGFYVAVLLLTPMRQWPYFLLGALPANLAFDLLHQRPLLMTLCFSLGNSLEAFAGAWLVQRFAGDPITLTTPKEVVVLFLGSALTSTTLSAFIGTTTLAVMTALPNYWITWLTWWTGDMMGVLVIAPMVLIGGRWRWQVLKPSSLRLSLEVTIFLILTAALTWITFSEISWPGIKGVYILIPLMVFVAMRLGLPGVVTVGFEMACLAVLRTSSNFNTVDLDQVLSLQAFLGTVVFMGLVVAAVLAQTEKERQAVNASEERFRSVLENSVDAAYRRDLRTDRYDYLSPVIEQVAGWSVEEMSSKNTPVLLARIHPDDLVRVSTAIENSIATTRNAGRVFEIVQYRLRGSDGRYRWLEDHFTVLNDAQGRPLYRQGFVRNVTARIQVEEALRSSEAKFRTIFEDAPIGMATIGMDYHFLTANAAFCKMLGYSLAELTGLTFSDLTHPDHRAQDITSVKRLSAGEIPIYRTEKRYLHKNGAIVWANLTLTVNRDAQGNFLHFLAMIEDITERVRLVTELEDRAIHDELTGVLNRWGLLKVIQAEINRAQRYHHPTSMILFDIDNFKQVNDTYGHAAGDQVLREITQLCRANIRASDSLARFGGDEFIILLPETGLEVGDRAAERMQQAVMDHVFIFENIQLNLTISIGLAVDTANLFTLDHFLRCADRALYSAKAAGKNCTRILTSANL